MAEPLTELAFRQGVAASRTEGPESQSVYNPYDHDEHPELYDAWEDGFYSDSDTRSEMSHLGI